jgi:proline iminopeptidase
VLLHGGPGAPHYYLEPLAEALAEGGPDSSPRPVLVYDQLGCGLSDKAADPGSLTVRSFADELAGLLSHLGIRRFHLLGQSWGAMLALGFLEAHGAEFVVASLTLSGPLVDTARWVADQKILLSELPERLAMAVNAAERSGCYDDPGYQEAMDVYYGRHLCMIRPLPAPIARTMEGLGMEVYLGLWGPSEFTCTGSLRDAGYLHLLPRLAMPVLYTCGQFDEARPETVAEFAALTPRSQFLESANASHQQHLEQPEIYIRALAAHLQSAEN